MMIRKSLRARGLLALAAAPIAAGLVAGLVALPASAQLNPAVRAPTGNFPQDQFVRLVNDNSLDCLGIQNGSKTGGALAIQWSCNGNTDQYWLVG